MKESRLRGSPKGFVRRWYLSGIIINYYTMSRTDFETLLESTRFCLPIQGLFAPILEKKTWEQIALTLYQMLDNINTTDNVLKESVEGFCKFVMKKQLEKNQYLTSDGFNVTRLDENNIPPDLESLANRTKHFSSADTFAKRIKLTKEEVQALKQAGFVKQEPRGKLIDLRAFWQKVNENLTNFAQNELKLAGLFDKDSDYEGMIGEAVMELIQTFAKQDHSGCSAGLTREIFDKLSSFKPLTELTDSLDEWMKVGEDKGLGTCWQSKRCPSCFSHDGGKTYYDLDEMKDSFEKRTMHTSKHFVGS